MRSRPRRRARVQCHIESVKKEVMATRNEIKVELRGIHLCCQSCVDAADAALMSVEGLNSRCDMENGT